MAFADLDDGFKVNHVEKNSLRNLFHALGNRLDGEIGDYYHFDQGYDFYVG